MADRQGFMQLMTAAAPLLKISEDKAYELLLDQWWAKVRMPLRLALPL